MVIGILAHVDAGKTTLSEAMLYFSGTIRQMGRVDNRDAFLDTYELERSRGITIFSKQAVFTLGGRQITLLDTPGHVDFSAEMERTLQVLDVAVLVINGMDGVQGHTLTLWRLLKKYSIPVFIFVNKMDQAGTGKEALLKDIKGRLNGECIDFTEKLSGGDEREFYENIAVAEEEMLDILMPVCAPAWKGEEGKTDKEMLAQFYTLAKRIWDAESAGLGEEEREEYVKWLEDMRTSGFSEDSIREANSSVSNKMLGMMRGEKVLAAGILMYDSGVDVVTSVIKEMGEEENSFAAYKGQAKDVFVPGSLMGINRTSKNQEMAALLLEAMLDNHSWEGMAVNKAQWNENMREHVTEDGGPYATMGGAESDGSLSYTLDLYQSSEEDIQYLEKLVKEARVPYVREAVLEDAAAEVGVRVLRGELSPLAGAEEVMQKTAIYMAE